MRTRLRRRHRFTVGISTVLAGFTLGVLPASFASGQVMLSPALSEAADAKGDAAAAAAGPTFELRPRRQPIPVLRYRLWPAPEDRRQRAAMVAVNRSMLLVAQVPSQQKRTFLQRYDEWSQRSISELPVEDAKAACVPFETAIGVLRTGENWMDLSYDLGMTEMSFDEKLGTLLPEFQEMRDLARLLGTRARIAAAERRWDDAVDELRLGFRLSEIAGHGTQTILGRLIGIAIAETMFDTIESMIQQPDCPNLYWALAGLPIDHLFKISDVIEYESTLWHHLGIIAGFDELPDQVIGEEQAVYRLRKIAGAYAMAFEQPDLPAGQKLLRQIMTGFEVASMVAPARRLLAESPDWSHRLDELSDAELVLRASDFDLARIRDRWMAWSLLPSRYWDGYEDRRSQAIRLSADPETLGGLLIRRLIPDSRSVTAIGIRIRQDHHRLMTLEALRMHVAESGALPESIEKLSPVPAWIDPAARGPFVYQRKSQTEATLTKSESPRNRDELTTTIRIKVDS